jgi:hypothetical protein
MVVVEEEGGVYAPQKHGHRSNGFNFELISLSQMHVPQHGKSSALGECGAGRGVQNREPEMKCKWQVLSSRTDDRPEEERCAHA